MNYPELAQAIKNILQPLVATLNHEFGKNPAFVQNEFIPPWEPIFRHADGICYDINWNIKNKEEYVRTLIDQLIDSIDGCIKSPATNSAWYTREGGVKDQLVELKIIVTKFNKMHPGERSDNNSGGPSVSDENQPHHDASSSSSKSSKSKPASYFTKSITRLRPTWF